MEVIKCNGTRTIKQTPNGFAETLGLIFIVYLTDTDMGYFQLIKNSQGISLSNFKNDFSDQFVDDNLKNNTVSFPGKKGTMIIYDSRMLHRAKPFENDDFIRKSLFIQVDADVSDSETILLNASFLIGLNPRKIEYLGIGAKTTQKSWPQTTRNHLIEYMNKENKV